MSGPSGYLVLRRGVAFAPNLVLLQYLLLSSGCRHDCAVFCRSLALCRGGAPHTQVQLRAVARQRAVPDLGRNWQRLEALRIALGWQPVPILRARTRAVVVMESPFDRFGPPPPPGAQLDYEALLRDADRQPNDN